MPRVQRYPEETPVTDLERRVAIIEGIIRGRFEEGTGVIVAGNTTLIVTHGLGVSPSSVFLTPSSALIAIRADTRTSTTFTVTRSGTSGNVGFFWLAVP